MYVQITENWSLSQSVYLVNQEVSPRYFSKITVP